MIFVKRQTDALVTLYTFGRPTKFISDKNVLEILRINDSEVWTNIVSFYALIFSELLIFVKRQTDALVTLYTFGSSTKFLSDRNLLEILRVNDIEVWTNIVSLCNSMGRPKV